MTTLSPPFEESDYKSVLEGYSDTSPKPTGSPFTPERSRLVGDSHLPVHPYPAAPLPLSEFLRLIASQSDENPPKLSSLQRAVASGRADIVSWFLRKGADVHKKDLSGATLLHGAVSGGFVDIVRLLLGHGADANATDSRGRAPMHLVPAGRSDIVQLLVIEGSEISFRDSNGNSGLMLAVLQGQAERVRTYLLNGADVNMAEPIPSSMTIEGVSALPPILIAVHQRQNNVLKILVEHGADLRPTFAEDGWTVLHQAAATHNHEAVGCLILAKIDLEVREGSGFTALHVAAETGASTVVELLVDAGADIEARSVLLRTPLHQAARDGQLEVVRRLLDKGAAIHSRDTTGETALHIACHNRCDMNVGVIKHLLDRGANFGDQAGLSKRLPPHHAALFGFKEAVNLFINRGFDKASPDAQGLQMIHHAASNGHVDVLELLLERGAAAFINARVDVDPLLHLAARGGHDQAVSFLCTGKLFQANVNFRAWKDGCSAIHYAAQCGHAKVISVLHKSGANIDAVDNQGNTALFYAVQGGHARTISLLCDYGASFNFGSCNALVEAACRVRVDIVSLLCKRGASVHVNVDTRVSPLIEATKLGNTEVVRILLHYGAEVEVRSTTVYWTPLHIAANRNYKEILGLLLEKGADRQALTMDGKTAWALAQEVGNGEICQILGRPPVQAKPDTGGRAPDFANTSSRTVAAGGKPSDFARSKKVAAGGKVSESAHGKEVAASGKKASKRY